MRNFFFKLLIMIVLVSLSLLGLNYAYINTNAYYLLNDTAKFENVPKGIEICNLGSSHGQKSFNYSEINERGFNFGLSGQDFYYDLQVLKQYSENLRKGAVVLIVLSYFSYNMDLFEGEFFNRSPRYYTFLDQDLIYNTSFPNLIKYRYLPIITAGGNIKSWIPEKLYL